MIRAIVFCFASMLLGCAGITPMRLDPKIWYASDITLNVDGVESKGFVVAPNKNEYEITIETPGKIDLLKITSCARQVSTEHIRSGFFKVLKSKKKYKYIYNRNSNFENRASCLLKFEAFEMGVEGRHSFGVVAFQTGKETIDFGMTCNGQNYNFKGVGFCETAEMLNVKIWFSEKVFAVSNDKKRCPIDDSGTEFTMKMPNRMCMFKFMDKSGKFAVLHTVGYEHIAIREK